MVSLRKQETDMNNNFELSIDELDAVAGGAKGDSGALDAAKKIDLSAFLAQMDKAIALAKQI
jgi:hypothetical protein